MFKSNNTLSYVIWIVKSWMTEESVSPCPGSPSVVVKYSDLSNLEVSDGSIVYISSEEKLVVKRAKAWTLIQVFKFKRFNSNYLKQQSKNKTQMLKI